MTKPEALQLNIGDVVIYQVGNVPHELVVADDSYGFELHRKGQISEFGSLALMNEDGFFVWLDAAYEHTQKR